MSLPDDAKNASQDPSHGTGFGVGAGADLTLAMRTSHVHRVRTEVGGIHVLHDDRGVTGSRALRRGAHRGRGVVGGAWNPGKKNIFIEIT